MHMRGRHIMLDNETLATSTGAILLQIGGCEFFPEERRIGQTFNSYIDLGSSMAAGRLLDPDTFLWWLQQSDEARMALVDGLQNKSDTLNSVLMVLADFCMMSNGRRGLGAKRELPEGVWGHGSSFDISQIEDCYHNAHIDIPWRFQEVRDTRTIFDLCGTSLGDEVKLITWPDHLPPRVHHEASSDAVAQALAIMACLDRISVRIST